MPQISKSDYAWLRSTSVKLSEDVRYGWLAALGSFMWLIIFIVAQWIANQHISQAGNYSNWIAAVALCGIFAMVVGAILLIVEHRGKKW